MTDWPRLLLPASFNGQGFYVESGTAEAGHSVSTTKIPNGRHINESFGPNARKFEVTAYLTGALSHVRAEGFLSAAETRHRGVLILPDIGPSLVRLTKAKREFQKDKLGYLALSLEAVAEPVNSGLRLSANALEAQIYAVAGLAATAFGLFSGSSFRLAGQPSTVQEAAFDTAAVPLGDLVALRDSVRLDPAGRDAIAPAFSAATLALGGLIDDPSSYGTALANAAIALGDAADPATLAETIVAFGAPEDAAAPQVSQGTALIIAENAGYGVALQSAARALALGEAQARRTYRDRGEAIGARAIATAVFDDALSRAGRAGLDMARELSAMKGLIAELTVRREADLAPLITVSAGRSLPSLVWAWSLYADPLRAEDLALRAGVPHPGFMPERFESLAS